MKFYHCNHDVHDLDRSVAFYETYFGLRKVREVDSRIEHQKLVFMEDPQTGMRLELTCLDGQPPYDVGNNPFHVAFYSDTWEQDLARHREAGLVVEVRPEVGVYFIKDVDGYLMEVVDQLHWEKMRKQGLPDFIKENKLD